MVQRKATATSKLGIQANHYEKTENRVENRVENQKPLFSCWSQDGKSRGPDKKRKMKKSMSIMVSDAYSLRSSSSMSNNNKMISQHGKSVDESPNYMKSTICSMAKKIVNGSSRCSVIASNTASLKKPASSLKIVRRLSKTPSLKAKRACCNGVSGGVVRADINMQKVTCSSTLKGSKFPAFLELNTGSNETKGTSRVKVCRYSCCSLNSHSHGGLSPPLTSFLSEKRRLLKPQRSLKLQALTSRKAKTLGQEIPAYNKEVEGKLPIYNLVQDNGADFFVKVHAKEKEAEANGGNVYNVSEFVAEHEDQIRVDFGGVNEVTSWKSIDEQIDESLSDGAIQSDIDFEEMVENRNDLSSIVLDDQKSFCFSDHTDQESEEECPCVTSTCRCRLEGGHEISFEEVEFVYEDVNKEWEAWNLSDSGTDHEAKYSDSVAGCLIDSKENKSTETIPEWHNEIVIDQVSQDFFQEESLCYMAQSDDNDSEMETTQLVVNPRQLSDNSNRNHHVSFTDCEVQEMIPVAKETRETNTGLLDNVVTPPVANKKIQQNIGATIAEKITIETVERKCTSEGIIDAEGRQSSINISNGTYPTETRGHASQGKCRTVTVENQIFTEKDQDEAQKSKFRSLMDSESDSMMCSISFTQNSINEVMGLEAEGISDIGTAETTISTIEKSNLTSGSKVSYYQRKNSSQDLPNTSNKQKWTIQCRPTTEDTEESRKFNPQEPSYLPIVPDRDAEKIDLRHHEIGDQKNTEEWMLDYALQQTVSKLAPAMNRRVALLTEAFETVTENAKWKPHTSAAFGSRRSIQACS